MQLSPSKLVSLEVQMIPYLCSLELGERTTPEVLLANCNARQMQALTSSTDRSPSVYDVPSLTEFEASLRMTQMVGPTGTVYLIDFGSVCRPGDPGPMVVNQPSGG